jgi:oxygen-independent coproporphyrinogen-3 oxidase
VTLPPDPRAFGVYVHWPFCRSKCPYCDFNSHVREKIEAKAWERGLIASLKRQKARFDAQGLGNRTVSSIFFGGGTPSLMPPRLVGTVIETIAHLWPLDADTEITLEANPTSAEAENFAGYAAAGVNRLSIGVQALEKDALGFLGRTHDPDEARRAIALARQHFPRFSFDLIYARPGQSVAAWEAELRQALDLAVGHLSLYQLTIEPGTAFYGAHARGDFALPDDALAGDLYEATQALLTAAGLPAYEISNHARPGQESRHNLLYWRYGDYLGVGPGAHGRLTLDDGAPLGRKLATRAQKAPETWLAALEAGEDGLTEVEPVAVPDRLTELTMMGLRLAEGVPLARYLRETGLRPDASLDAPGLSRMIEGGFLAQTDTHLTATEAGRQRLNALLTQILPEEGAQ